MSEALRRDLEVDLFNPPQREEHRRRVVELRAAGWTELRIAAELGITKTAVQQAAALQRRMDSLELSDPYLPVTEPPNDYGRLRRHRHSRYRFEALNNDDRR